MRAKLTDGGYAKRILGICDSHYKKYGKRKMCVKELDELCGVS